VPELERLELLTPGQIGGLVMACELWSTYCGAMDVVKKKGILIKTKVGMVRNPAIGIAQSSLKEYRAWAVQYGLTPASEGRLKPREADGAGESPFQ